MKLPLNTKYCLCSACGEYFTNVANFDMHRRGEPTARVCLDPAHITSKTGKAKLRLNAKGYWAQTGGAYIGGFSES